MDVPLFISVCKDTKRYSLLCSFFWDNYVTEVKRLRHRGVKGLGQQVHGSCAAAWFVVLSLD